MQLIRNIEQGSEAWLKLRLGVATASNFSKIITSKTAKISAGIDKYALQLATEKMLIEPEETYQSEAMKRGNDLEPDARQRYCEETLQVVECVTMFLSNCGNYGYSPDGLVEQDGLIEIKCPLATTHANYIINRTLPSEYLQQVQGGLWISGRKWCDFVSYHPNFKENDIFIIRVERDEHYIELLKDAVLQTIEKRDELLLRLNEAR